MAFFIESDPLLAYSFCPDSDNLFYRHAHEVIFFTVFFHVLYLFAPVVNNVVFGRKWFQEEVDDATRENFNVRFVGIVQAFLSILACIPMFQHPLFYSNPIDGSYDFALLVASFTVGYFIWDLFYCCLFHYELYGPEFLFHAFGALFVFGTTLMPFCQPYLCSFLIFEASTPFVQFHFMMTRSKMWPSWLITINGVLLILSFFLVRIIWGVFATFYSIYLIWPMKDQYPTWLLIGVYGLNIGFQFLNFTWFGKMVKMAKRLAGGTPPKTLIKEEEQKKDI